MSKLLLASAICVTGAGGSTATAYGFGAFGSGEKGSSKHKEGSDFDARLPRTLDGLRKFGGGDCIKRYFPGLEVSTLTTPTQEEEYVNLGIPKAGDTTNIDACLAIDWSRNEYGDGKEWDGDFRWLYSMVKGDKGLISFNVAAKESGLKELRFVKVSYALARGENGNWSVKDPANETVRVPGDEGLDSSGGVTEIVPETTESSGAWTWSYSDVDGFAEGTVNSWDEITLWSKETLSYKDLADPVSCYEAKETDTSRF